MNFIQGIIVYDDSFANPGQPTVFFKESVLKPWKEVHEEVPEEFNIEDELPF